MSLVVKGYRFTVASVIEFFWPWQINENRYRRVFKRSTYAKRHRELRSGSICNPLRARVVPRCRCPSFIVTAPSFSELDGVGPIRVALIDKAVGKADG